MQLVGLILLIASSWYLWKLTNNFLDEKTTKEIKNNIKNYRSKFIKLKNSFSKEKFQEAWKEYKSDGGTLANKEKE